MSMSGMWLRQEHRRGNTNAESQPNTDKLWPSLEKLAGSVFVQRLLDFLKMGAFRSYMNVEL